MDRRSETLGLDASDFTSDFSSVKSPEELAFASKSPIAQKVFVVRLLRDQSLPWSQSPARDFAILAASFESSAIKQKVKV